MIVTIYAQDGEKYTFFDVKEFTVTGAMSVKGTDEVEFGKQGFRFKDNSAGRATDEKEQSANTHQ